MSQSVLFQMDFSMFFIYKNGVISFVSPRSILFFVLYCIVLYCIVIFTKVTCLGVQLEIGKMGAAA